MMTIGKLAARCGVSADAIRFYEREGLLKARTRTASGYRQFDDADVRRIAFIQHAQQCGFSLADVGQLLEVRALATGCCSDVRRVATEKRLALESRIRTLASMAGVLDRLIAACDDTSRPLEECPILAAMGGERGPVRRRG